QGGRVIRSAAALSAGSALRGRRLLDGPRLRDRPRRPCRGPAARSARRPGRVRDPDRSPRDQRYDAATVMRWTARDLRSPSLGLLNYLLSRVGLHGPEWLIQPTTAIIAVSITTIWLTLGTNIIVLLSGLQGVPEEIYEAARLDGARGLRMFTRITVPMVSPSLFFLLVVDTVAVLQSFTQIHLLTRGGPVDATRTLVYSIYLDAFQNFQFGFASA